jgi:tetratricopeptide (TPR) repeat protein
VRSYINRGNALGRKGDHERAIEDYSAALEIDPQNAQAFYLRSLARKGKGDAAGAAADLASAKRIDPESAIWGRSAALQGSNPR